MAEHITQHPRTARRHAHAKMARKTLDDTDLTEEQIEELSGLVH